MSGIAAFSYWEKDSFLKRRDLIVTGAGIVGLSAALFYKRHHPGARVLVLDKGFFPEGASTRNAGFACVGSVTEHAADMEKESEAPIKERIAMRCRGLHLLRNTLGDAAIGYESGGGFELFTSQKAVEEAAGYMSLFNQWLHEITGEENVYRSATLNGYPVIHNRLEGMLHPGKMMRTLVRLATDEGIDIRWSAHVTSLSGDGIITLDNGMELKAGQLLAACNGFTLRLLPEINIRPARGYIMVTNPQPVLPWRGTFHYDRGYIYFRNLGSRLLIGGARNIALDEEATDQFGINPAVKDHLCKFTDDVLGLPSGWSVDCEWSGIMGFTGTKTPVLKRLDSHRVVAAGLSGMGVAIGMEIGREAANLLNDK